MIIHHFDKHDLMLLPGLAPDERTPQGLTVGTRNLAHPLGYG